jgi:CPA2 family monovalent cation:H+ antiporter-2
MKLRISPIVGYLLAGVLVGPHTPGFFADAKIAEELSEIGIVMLMFGVGLHFSVKDLLDVRRIALPGAIAQITCATVMGAVLAHSWGWPQESGLVFGLALSVASTVVMTRALEERNLLYTNNGRITVGWLIVEDLAMVLALVLIPTLAGVNGGTSHIDGSPIQQMFVAMGKIVLFMAVMTLAGRRVLPWLLMVVARTASRELFTLAVFATAVGLAFLSAKLFGVSFALGAFFAGMMIRESELHKEVATRTLPFQDAFSVLFFVAVGMLFDPMVVIENPLRVLAVLGIIMFGKSIASFLIVLMSGYSIKAALIVSASLAQIGEFSFILIALGLTLDLLPPEGRDLILAGALISISLNPLMFRLSQFIYEFVEDRPYLFNLIKMGRDEVALLPEWQKEALKNPIILVGYGRVGKHIARHLRVDGMDLVVIDANRERTEFLRLNGFYAIAGDAAQKPVLKEAGADRALAIVIAVPDSFEARRIIESAKKLNPSIRILVRAHNDEELNFFMRQNVDLAVTGPHEISRRIMDYLHSIQPQSEP